MGQPFGLVLGSWTPQKKLLSLSLNRCSNAHPHVTRQGAYVRSLCTLSQAPRGTGNTNDARCSAGPGLAS